MDRATPFRHGRITVKALLVVVAFQGVLPDTWDLAASRYLALITPCSDPHHNPSQDVVCGAVHSEIALKVKELQDRLSARKFAPSRLTVPLVETDSSLSSSSPRGRAAGIGAPVDALCRFNC